MPAMATMGMLRAARQSRGMKVRSSVKKMCEGCKVRSFTFAGMGQWEDGTMDWVLYYVYLALAGVRAGRRHRESTFMSALCRNKESPTQVNPSKSPLSYNFLTIIFPF